MPTYVEHLISDIEGAIKNREIEIASKEAERNRSWTDEKYRDKMVFDRHIQEVERYIHEDPPTDQNMYYHLGFQPEQFPPIENLTVNEANVLVCALLDLWNVYHFDVAIPDGVPPNVLYPLLLKKMYKPAFLMEEGFTVMEFCDYDHENCPFGKEWCDCKQFAEESKTESESKV